VLEAASLQALAFAVLLGWVLVSALATLLVLGL